MVKDNVIGFKKPDAADDLLTEIIRQGARQLLAAAVEAEVEEFLSKHNIAGEKPQFVRNGHLPERAIQTGIGDVIVEVPLVRNRSYAKNGLRFGSSVIPKYIRRSGKLEAFIP